MWTRFHEVFERRMGIFMIIGALIAGGAYYVQVNEQEERSKCQNRVNTAFAENIVRRSAVSVASDKAQSTLLLGVAELLGEPEATSTREERERAAQFLLLFSNFRSDSAEVDKLRAANPYPDIESICK